MKTLIFNNGSKKVAESDEVIDELVFDGVDFKITEYNEETDMNLPYLSMDEYGNIIIYK